MIMMDGLVPVFARGNSSRSISASAAERTLLLGALATHMGVLDTRENDAQTVLRKSELWDEITRHFNKNTSTPRSRQQIQTLYKNMKAKARRYEARLAEMASGIPPPDPDPISEMLLGLLHQQFRHQQRHLRNLMTTTRESNGVSSELDHQPTVVHQMGPSFINPEQMMQISLSEGTAEDIDIKSENNEGELGENSVDLSSENTLSRPPSEASGITEKALPVLPVPNISQDSTDVPVNSHVLGVSIPSPPMALPSSNIEVSDSRTTPPSLITSNSTEMENQHSVLMSKLQIPQVTPNLHSGFMDRRPQLAPKNSNIPQTASNSSDFFAALRNLSSPEETPVRKIPLDLRSESIPRSGSISPTPKRPRIETLTKNYISSASRNLSCCCPDIHAKLLGMAQEEHLLKMSLLKRDQELKEYEHAARMRILEMEEEEARIRLEKAEMPHLMRANGYGGNSNVRNSPEDILSSENDQGISRNLLG